MSGSHDAVLDGIRKMGAMRKGGLKALQLHVRRGFSVPKLQGIGNGFVVDVVGKSASVGGERWRSLRWNEFRLEEY